MKKIVLLSIAISAISLTSCKKDRTCTCTGTTTDVETTRDPGGNVVTTITTSDPESYTDVLKGTTKAAAKGHRDCISRIKTSSSSYISGSNTVTDDITTDLNCTIK